MSCHIDIYIFQLYCKCNKTCSRHRALLRMCHETETARALQAFAAVCLLFCFLGGQVL